MTLNNSLLTTKQAAELLQCKPQTLDSWRCHSIGPKFCIIGARSIRYRMEDLEAFVRVGQPKETDHPCGDACKCNQGEGR